MSDKFNKSPKNIEISSDEEDEEDKNDKFDKTANLMVITQPNGQRFKCSVCKAIFFQNIEAKNHVKYTHLLPQKQFIPIMPNSNMILPKVPKNQFIPIMPNRNMILPKAPRQQFIPILPNGNTILPKVSKNQFIPILPKSNTILPEKRYIPKLPNSNMILPEKQYIPILPNSNMILQKKQLPKPLPQQLSNQLNLTPFQKGLAGDIRKRQQAIQSKMQKVKMMKIDELLFSSKKSILKKLPDVNTPSGLLASLFPPGRRIEANPLDVDHLMQLKDDCLKDVEPEETPIKSLNDVNKPSKDWSSAEFVGFPLGWKYKAASAWSRRIKFMSPQSQVFNTRTSAVSHMENQKSYTEKQIKAAKFFEENSQQVEAEKSDGLEEYSQNIEIEPVNGMDFSGQTKKRKIDSSNNNTRRFEKDMRIMIVENENVQKKIENNESVLDMFTTFLDTF